jgi:membrane protein
MMSYKEVPDLLKAAAVNWMNDYAQSMGAALAFYTMFSIAPLLLIVIAVAGFGAAASLVVVLLWVYYQHSKNRLSR